MQDNDENNDTCVGCGYHYTQRWCYGLYVLDKCRIDGKIKGFTNIIFNKTSRRCNAYVKLTRGDDEDVEEIKQS